MLVSKGLWMLVSSEDDRVWNLSSRDSLFVDNVSRLCTLSLRPGRPRGAYAVRVRARDCAAAGRGREAPRKRSARRVRSRAHRFQRQPDWWGDVSLWILNATECCRRSLSVGGIVTIFEFFLGKKSHTFDFFASTFEFPSRPNLRLERTLVIREGRHRTHGRARGQGAVRGLEEVRISFFFLFFSRVGVDWLSGPLDLLRVLWKVTGDVCSFCFWKVYRIVQIDRWKFEKVPHIFKTNT